MLLDEESQEERVAHFFFHREVLVVGLGDEIGVRVLNDSFDIACLMVHLRLEEAEIEIVCGQTHVLVELALSLHLLRLENLLLLMKGHSNVFVELIKLALE